MEASTELRKSVFGTDIDAEDYAKKMVELVEKRRREIRETKLKAKKNKPITHQADREYYIDELLSRSQCHGWSIPHLRSFFMRNSGAKKKKQKVLDVEDILILEFYQVCKEEGGGNKKKGFFKVKQPVLKIE
ncbi:hypothetical protein Tco_0159075 [Tanacetum coccineum]|uniref:Uncharacterized protein n=1 Tax=Tanacetum coccineum TaxID=301880 RepID=A0ABQ5GCD2_9ASTR